MYNHRGLERYLVLYAPWLLSLIFQSNPAISYLIAWFGSFFIFLITLTGWVKPIPNDRSTGEQLMRPLFIMQIIFAGFTCCTSIFYYFDTIGYSDFKKVSDFYLVDQTRLMLAAQCQRYYCLGHASFVTGILLFMKYPSVKKYYIETNTIADLLLKVALVSFPVSIVFATIPGLTQFYFQLNSLSFIAGTLALAFAIPLKKPINTLICATLYAFNLYQAFHSGFKEPIIVSLLVLGVFLYPTYKKLVIAIFGPLLFVAFIFLPSYVNSFRENAWSGDADVAESSKIAVDAALNEDNDESNWDFFTYRLSEIDMFTVFVQSTPKHIDYYGVKLLKQSVIAIIPRVFWPEKPITESLVMERVYDAGVVNRLSNVSAKPAFIVDAYLSAGPIGIAISLFLYGAIAQLISVKAETIFGGYILGSALIFSGLFQILWRGLSFEFLINAVFWSYISMLIIFNILKRFKILKEV